MKSATSTSRVAKSKNRNRDPETTSVALDGIAHPEKRPHRLVVDLTDRQFTAIQEMARLMRATPAEAFCALATNAALMGWDNEYVLRGEMMDALETFQNDGIEFDDVDRRSFVSLCRHVGEEVAQ